MTNRGGVACGLATAKIHAKIGEQRVQKSKNETKRGKKRNINRKQAGKWAWATERGRHRGEGARLAWRPRVQRGVGQVQRRLKSLIIASNALAQRAPRRATKKEREENPKTKMLREKMQKCATKRSAKRGWEGGGAGRVAGGGWSHQKEGQQQPKAGAAKCSSSNSSRDTSTRCNE